LLLHGGRLHCVWDAHLISIFCVPVLVAGLLARA